VEFAVFEGGRLFSLAQNFM